MAHSGGPARLQVAGWGEPKPAAPARVRGPRGPPVLLVSPLRSPRPGNFPRVPGDSHRGFGEPPTRELPWGGSQTLKRLTRSLGTSSGGDGRRKTRTQPPAGRERRKLPELEVVGFASAPVTGASLPLRGSRAARLVPQTYLPQPAFLVLRPSFPSSGNGSERAAAGDLSGRPRPSLPGWESRVPGDTEAATLQPRPSAPAAPASAGPRRCADPRGPRTRYSRSASGAHCWKHPGVPTLLSHPCSISPS